MVPVALHAFNPGPLTGSGNWTWLIPGRVPTLIDAGVGDPRHLDAIDAALNGVALAQVVVTHGHSDHAGGAAAVAARHPGARVLKWPWHERDGRWPVAWTAVRDGEEIKAGDTRLAVVHTPGHSPDHICLWHAATRTIFAGDLAIQGTTVFIPGTRGGNLTAYLASLDRVLALAPARMLPAHGPVIDDPDALLREYIAHRREREQQILDALRAGKTSVDAIVEQVYQGLDAQLIPRARETVIAHLDKLDGEGRVRREGNRWTVTD